MRRPLTLAAGLAAASALVLSACSSDGAQSGAKAEEAGGPLWEYMAAMWEGEDWNEDFQREQDRQREDLIAQCMAEQGFEYTPDTGNTFYYSGDEDSDGPDWGTREFAEQYGFGVIDWPGMQEMEEQQEGQEYTDPNWDYVSTLSESEQNAFYEALHGPGPTEEEMALMEEDEDYMWQPEDQGCWGWAYQKVNEGTTIGFYDDPEFADLIEAMNAMWEDTQNDPEMVSLNTDWSACMVGAGYPEVTVRDDIHSWIYDQYSALMEGPTGEWVELTPEQKEEFREFEIAAAVADWDCQKEVNWDKRYAEIDTRVQQEFLDAHKDQLDAALAKYAGK